MYKIQANASGTRSIEISEQHLQTIERYSLLKNLIDSNGIIDESVLDKLKLNVRSMLESEAGKDKDLLDLCLDVSFRTGFLPHARRWTSEDGRKPTSSCSRQTPT